MSVIASNSVNFVPIYQLLKNFSDTKPNGFSQSQQFEKISSNIFDFADLSIINRVGQTNPISALLAPENIEKPNNVVFQEKVLDEKEKNIEMQSVIQNADSLKSFIRNSKEEAMSQQANQLKQNAMLLI